MTPFLLYLLRASLYLAIFYAFYLLVMRRTSLFRFNRIALLVGTAVCHLLPLLRLRTVILPEIAIPLSPATLEPAGEPVGASAAPFPWLIVLYAFGVAAVLLLSALSLARTRRIIRSGVRQECEGCRLTLVDRDIPSFSWGRDVVMSRSDYEKYPAILGHELQHIRAHHSLDVLLITAVNAAHWFNPLVWMARAELRLLHEYEADEGLIRKGIDATQYQLLLVRKAVGEQRFSLANGFNHAKLKQRINMMHKTPSSSWMRLCYAAVLPVLAATMFVANPARARVISTSGEVQTAVQQDTTKAVPYAQIEKKPTFQGNDASLFGKWVAENLTYPQEAKEDGIQGRVMVQFTICEDGAVRDVKVLRGVHPLLDAEAVRVISASPAWEPGIQDGKPVKVTFQFPIIFKERGNDVTVVSVTNVKRSDETRNVDGTQTVSVTAIPLGDGTKPAIYVRGANGAEPLILLDGVKLADGKKGLENIDSSTIESIEVLKDAATIAKYGEEGKNGVILITSKK